MGSAVANVSASRLQLDVSLATPHTPFDSGDGPSPWSTSAQVDALSVSEPPGLTFSPAGLSPGRSSRFVADL